LGIFGILNWQNFISDELENSFNSLPEDDFVKKSMIRAIKDLK